jgi:hypothetical protein
MPDSFGALPALHTLTLGSPKKLPEGFNNLPAIQKLKIESWTRPNLALNLKPLQFLEVRADYYL